MSAKRLLIAALVAVAMLATSALAQKNELTGIIGRTFISEQLVPNTGLPNSDVHFGKGLTFEVNYGRHFWGEGFTRFAFEVPVVFNLDEDIQFHQNLVPESFRSYIVTPSVRANVFANTAVSPWASIGGGFGHFSPSSNLVFGGSSPAKSNTTGVMQIGAGLDVRVLKSFSVRGEVRDFWSGTPNLNVVTDKSRQHNVFVGGGIIWHFGKI
jgi:opacity protein-like surface antigen